MSRTNNKNSQVDKWQASEKSLLLLFPHIMGVAVKEAEFIELRLKARDDGSTLAIIKQYGEDGGPLVAFGVGYGVTLALMALDKTLQGGHWRIDKPWNGA